MAQKLPKKDVVIIGLGAAGGYASMVLAKAGLEVVGLEAGPRWTPQDFPMDELRPHSMAGPNRSRGRESDEPEPVLLGDVVLCPQVAAVQAKQHGQSAQAELELLTVHGVLHLLGYDHAEPEEHAAMFGTQDQLLRAWRDTKEREGTA